MASKQIQIADAVKALIDAHGAAIGAPVTEPVEAERVYLTEDDLSRFETLRVTVFPSAQTAALDSRAGHRFTYAVDVGIRRKCKASDTEILDSLMEVAELVVDVLRSNRLDLAGLGNPIPLEVANDPIFSVTHLQEQNLFLAVVRVVYSAGRAMT